MSYIVLDTEKFTTLPHRIKTKKHPKLETGGRLLITKDTSLELIPENSHLTHAVWFRQNVWELNLPKDYNKSVKKLAKRLDAIAYM